MSGNIRQLIEPKHLAGVNFNIRDHAKFQQALQLLRESTCGLPMFAADNLNHLEPQSLVSAR